MERFGLVVSLCSPSVLRVQLPDKFQQKEFTDFELRTSPRQDTHSCPKCLFRSSATQTSLPVASPPPRAQMCRMHRFQTPAEVGVRVRAKRDGGVAGQRYKVRPKLPTETRQPLTVRDPNHSAIGDCQRRRGNLTHSVDSESE